ncbi:MAG: hypothetical protein RMJ66_05595 [Bacteroidia bacterium]|nr:hypothetical protein [Bacteroidia bacterium]MDW8134523.1 hypothetical protein [Bacteroidia bacterium]
MRKILTGITLLTSLLACVRKPEPPESIPQPHYAGIFILNEGQWTLSNASLDVLSPTGPETYTYYEDAFRAVNQKPLGDVANHWLRSGDTLWIVMNGSRLLRCLILPTLREAYIVSFPSSASPREFLLLSPTKAYVNSLLDGYVYRLNPLSGQLTPPHIPIEKYAESMVYLNGRIWVSCGNYAYPARNNKIACILPEKDSVEYYITLPRENPGPLLVLPNGELLVGCRGNYADQKGMLVHVNPDEGTITHSVPLQTSVYRLQRYGSEVYMLTDSGISRYDWQSQQVEYSFITHRHLGIQPHELIYGFYYDSLLQSWLVANAKAGGTRGEVLFYKSGNVYHRQRVGVFPARLIRYP